jgi:hypothetical protein
MIRISRYKWRVTLAQIDLQKEHEISQSMREFLNRCGGRKIKEIAYLAKLDPSTIYDFRQAKRTRMHIATFRRLRATITTQLAEDTDLSKKGA